MPTLDIQHLYFERNNNFLLEDISIQLSDGELLQVNGSNGIGKSTLLRILAGLIPVEKHSVLWNNQCITKIRDSFQQQLHYIGHQNGCRPQLTVKENLQLNAALNNHNNNPINHAAERMGLKQQLDRPAMQLSAGQRRRLALARLLLTPHTLWILDEPMTALDKEGRELLNQLIEEHTHQGGMAIIATHQDFAANNKKTLALGNKNV